MKRWLLIQKILAIIVIVSLFILPLLKYFRGPSLLFDIIILILLFSLPILVFSSYKSGNYRINHWIKIIPIGFLIVSFTIIALYSLGIHRSIGIEGVIVIVIIISVLACIIEKKRCKF
ncbi:MAG TPA: hypothetical protein ENI36_03930 [Thermoplasmatales archaeon]|nr:hypothetical protein [Thermoplasmatales archaeon]